MVLDENLFTYTITRSSDKWKVTHNQEEYFEKTRSKVSGIYAIQLSDSLSNIVLAEGQSKPLSNSKELSVILHNPSVFIQLCNTAKIGFEWTFEYEGEIYKWTRDNAFQKDLTCKMLRKPDPSIAIALYDQKDKFHHRLSILDYNVERTKVKDRKGLEYILLICIFAFIDKDKDEDLSKMNADFQIGEEIKGSDIGKEEKEEKEEKEKSSMISSSGFFKIFKKSNEGSSPPKLPPKLHRKSNDMKGLPMQKPFQEITSPPNSPKGKTKA